MTATVHDHKPEELCEAGLELYARALRDGHVPAHTVTLLTCPVDAGLLQPDFEDPSRLNPVAPAVALPRLLRTVDEDVAHRRRQGARLAEAFEPLLAMSAPRTDPAEALGIRVLSGIDRINVAISEAMAGVSGEVLAIQPHSLGNLVVRAASLRRDQDLLDRGGRIRALYQHTVRHQPAITARYEQLRGDVEARTLDQVTERLLIIDRQVAFIPASKDRTLALEVRHPALVEYLVTVFDRFWHLATPMHPVTAQPPSPDGVTPRQHAIAALLVEGHTDSAIAERLGMNVRTARVHIAKLAATLGSESRAQLGYLIARSGILDPEHPEDRRDPADRGHREHR
ncbi:LuxR C-terminal-related transcriptional regulator [Streptomyces sp. NPDC086787]|uniref:helix-turn-helix transcriptional regulator n=1 Tax=Streptomyces sp. NPDC086787 TaxID=3365759 RepID=UPI0037F9842F